MKYAPTPAPATPFQKAGQVWDERLGSAHAQRRNWLKTYAYTTDRGAAFLNDAARKSDPLAQIGKRSVTGEIPSIVRASDRSSQVQ